MKDNEIKKVVRERYGAIARAGSSCCGPAVSCCSGEAAEAISRGIGYREDELSGVPEGANLGLGCGNPTAIADLREGETVVDLGSGAGFDCFLAAKAVGETGRVIGVDMTAEMVEKARANAEKGGYSNVEFRLGEIENLPLADNTADVIISNCVINLAPDKGRVFQEAFRVLKPGGRMMVSDIVLTGELPDFIRDSKAAYAGCVSGAIMADEYLTLIEKAGFEKVETLESTPFKLDFFIEDPAIRAFIEEMKVSPEWLREYEGAVLSMNVRAVKPV